MATILLAQLLHQTNTILPPGYSSDAHSLPDLIASAIDFVEAQDQRQWVVWACGECGVGGSVYCLQKYSFFSGFAVVRCSTFIYSIVALLESSALADFYTLIF